jgi:hypothetical protein
MIKIIIKKNGLNLLKKIFICITVFIILSLKNIHINSQENSVSRFEPILSSIGSHIGSEKEMILRLRDIDYINENIVFYDDENIDIVFDITNYKKDKRKAKSMRNAHEGVRYKVRFIIKGADPNGLLSGQLIEFYPVFMDIMQ